jgi:hypothetical protein
MSDRPSNHRPTHRSTRRSTHGADRLSTRWSAFRLAQTILSFVQHMGRMPHRLAKAVVAWLLRVAFVLNRRSRLTATGFVLPTVILLILVVTLTTGALIFRAFNSSTNTIANNQNRVIYNAATPAIDRARAKLEYLFDAKKDSRFPSGVPAEQVLMSMLLNNGATVKGRAVPALPGTDPYTLPGETRISIDGDTNADNAWSYRTDTNGDGTLDATVAYSIIFSTPPDDVGTAGQQPISGAQRLVGLTDAQKIAGSLQASGERRTAYARSGPISNAAGLSCGTGGGSRDGWYAARSSSSTLLKNFQVDAIVIPDTGAGGVTTLEMQQDRKLDSGNKWGAWFRTDMEITSGSTFQWNGAMHTESSLIIGRNTFEGHLISAVASCLFPEPSASEISVSNRGPEVDGFPLTGSGFLGLVMAGNSDNNNSSGARTATIYIHSNNPQSAQLTEDSDWVRSGLLPSDVRVKAPTLQGADQNNATSGTGNNFDQRQASTYDSPNTGTFQGRFKQKTEPSPYVDDTYRADNRYGPKPRYDNQIAIPTTKKSGDLITAADFAGRTDGRTADDLIRDTPASGQSSDNVGLDGYWERRARGDGLRLLVGERLELGNAFGWGGNPGTPAPATADNSITTDGLYPPVAPGTTAQTVSHSIQQNRTLRDNLSAVQSTAVYHAGVSQDVPAACLATTAHPGSPASLARSINFVPSLFTADTGTGATGRLLTDFFMGRGTNGWEFTPPTESDMSSTTSKFRDALTNLAQFAGDHVSDTRTGTFPPTQEADYPHPYPMLSMWGNFSNLRRALGTSYASLSPADKTYLYTAGCTMGMLAYNMNEVLSFDIDNATNRTALTKIARRIEEIITKTPAATRGEYTTAPVERILAELEFPSLSSAVSLSTAAADVPTADEVRVARILATRAQIIRDRAYGFERTPTESKNVEVGTVTVPVTVPALNGIGAASGLRKGYASDRDLVDRNSSPLTSSQQAALLKLYGNPVPADATTGAEAGIQPKWPSLYYLFPLGTHNHQGSGQRAQPANEPYIRDAYVSTIANPGTGSSRVDYEPLDPDEVDLAPKAIGGTGWTLPYASPTAATTRYAQTNFIIAPTSATDRQGTRIAVGFLDRVLYDGRERLPARVLDVDLGFLRQTAPSGVTNNTWLPKSGIVYAFREDAVREDGFSRPAGSVATVASGGQTDARTIQPISSTTPYSGHNDPPVGTLGISLKAVDYVPDPARRIHGFRVRDGARTRRVLAGVTDADNTKGLSLFTDNPVYVMGDFNLHEALGTEDALEEFRDGDRLWNYNTADAAYTRDEFYNRRAVDVRFGAPTTDEWRPSELLADAVYILSDDFCDGSALDGFWIPDVTDDNTLTSATKTLADNYRAFYHGTTAPSASPDSTGIYANKAMSGLYAPGCGDSARAYQRTSFLNQDRPLLGTATAASGPGATDKDVGWGPVLPAVTGAATTSTRLWLHENPYDRTSPVRVTRNGLPLTVVMPTADLNQAGTTKPPLLHPVTAADAYTAAGYHAIGAYTDNRLRLLMKARTPGQRVNAIVVSGLVPSRINQYNGGLHNFPRFLEWWTASGETGAASRPLWLSGSLLQLNFSNYADAPFDSRVWEPGQDPATFSTQKNGYYQPPVRFWGYDTALQLAPSSPAAARFVTPSAERSEFYTEVPVTDAYMKALCTNAVGVPVTTRKPC